MDQRAGGCLVSIPRCLTNINILLGSDQDIINTFKQIERSHWDYLDNYRDHNRRRYPTMSIQQYTQKLLQFHSINNISINDIQHYVRLYNRYKKSLATAGVVLYHRKDNNIYFVVVKMRFAKIWSMPKGKQETNEDLINTARREFAEETGIDLEDFLTKETYYHCINKTRFYLVESDVMTSGFNGFNNREVDSVKWVSTSEVECRQNSYSKQTVATARYLSGC